MDITTWGMFAGHKLKFAVSSSRPSLGPPRYATNCTIDSNFKPMQLPLPHTIPWHWSLNCGGAPSTLHTDRISIHFRSTMMQDSIVSMRQSTSKSTLWIFLKVVTGKLGGGILRRWSRSWEIHHASGSEQLFPEQLQPLQGELAPNGNVAEICWADYRHEERMNFIR